MEKINDELVGAKKIAIAGHVRPDGDCIGACTALYQYIMLLQHDLGIDQVDVYLEPFGNEFNMLNSTQTIKHTYESDEIYDLFISLDCGSLDRLGHAIKYFDSAKKTICIDHHISNLSFAQVNHVEADASSTCEVLYGLMEEALINKGIAESLYVGIIHDTGVFKHSNTSEKTMQIAGRLISKGIEYSKLIDESFYAKTHMQNQIMGRCLMESNLLLNGKVIVSSISRTVLNLYQASAADCDGFIDQLRVTKGVEVAILIYENVNHDYKVSLRSNGDVNVSEIAVFFGGGGHIKAAGATLKGPLQDVIDNICHHIEKQLKELQILNYEI